MDGLSFSPLLVFLLLLLLLLLLSCVVGVVAPGRDERCLWTFPLVDLILASLPRVMVLSPRSYDLFIDSYPLPHSHHLLIIPLLPPSPCVLLPSRLSSRQLLVTEIDWSRNKDLA